MDTPPHLAMGDDITQIFRKNLRAKMGGALAPPQRLGPGIGQVRHLDFGTEVASGFRYRSKG